MSNPDQETFWGSDRGAEGGDGHRFRLWRILSRGDNALLFLMLNPSTANDVEDDPTIRRCVGFARSWGFSRLEVVNLWPHRATDPDALFKCPLTHDTSLLNAMNLGAITSALQATTMTVAAYGAFLRKPGHEWELRRARAEMIVRVCSGVRDVFALGFTKAGDPKHPLYVRGDTKPILWKQRREANA